jgi:hypothetical protein
MTQTRSGVLRAAHAILAVLVTALAAALMTMAGATNSANAAPIFSDNFDRAADTFVSPWSSKNACAADRLTTDSAVKRKGTYSMKLKVKDSDVSPCTYTSNPRAQVEKTGLFAEGSERWIGHSTFFPANFPTIGTSHWLIFSSYGFRAPYNGSAPGKFRVRSGTSDVIEYARDERTNHDAIWRSTITKGTWTDLVVHVKFSTNASVGFVEVYKNGVRQTMLNGSTRYYYATLKPTQTGAGSWNLSHYRSRGAAPDITLWHDEAKVGTTYSEVAP